GAGVGQGRVEDLVDLVGAGGLAMAVAAVGGARLASGAAGLLLGGPLGEGGGLAFGLSFGLVGLGAGLGEVPLGALVVAAEAVVVQAELVVVAAELVELGADLLQLLQDAEGYGHRLEHLDRRRHRRLATADPARQLLWETRTRPARGAIQVPSLSW